MPYPCSESIFVERAPKNIILIRHTYFHVRYFQIFHTLLVWGDSLAIIVPTTFMLRVSFSPAPECVVADCWNRVFPTPIGAPGHRRCCYFMLYHSYSILLFGNFLKPDYHYTAIFGFCKKEIYMTLGPFFCNKMVQYLCRTHLF